MGAPFTLPETDCLDAIRADLDALLGRPPVEPDTAAQARAIHARRALERAADHAAALLPLLGLPRAVGADFAPVDPEAAADALDAAVVALDALDADPDLEPWLAGDYCGGLPLDVEAEPEHDEHTLGWREAVSQADLGHGTEDGEHSLGAPERHPTVLSMGHGCFESAAGEIRRIRNYASQTTWAQGRRLDGEREAEEGYDLPEGDPSELDDDGLWRGEGDESDREPSLGAPAGDGDQRHWAQGDSRDYEDVMEADGELAPGWYSRPSGPVKLSSLFYDHRSDMRALSRRAEAMKRAKGAPGKLRDFDELEFVGMGRGRAVWHGPFKRNGIPIMGYATA